MSCIPPLSKHLPRGRKKKSCSSLLLLNHNSDPRSAAGAAQLGDVPDEKKLEKRKRWRRGEEKRGEREEGGVYKERRMLGGVKVLVP